jgi:hypothetical protein
VRKKAAGNRKAYKPPEHRRNPLGDPERVGSWDEVFRRSDEHTSAPGLLGNSKLRPSYLKARRPWLI